MIYAIISDVHANEAALRAVLDDAAAQGAGKVVCLGDTVGYGPMPSAAVAMVRESCDAVLAGNHDDAVSGRSDPEDFIDLAGEAVSRHREELSAADLKWLRELPYVFEGDGFVAAHGDFVDPGKFFYVEDEADAKANFERTSAQLMFVGHTHVPGLAVTGNSGAVYVTGAQDFTLEPNKRYIVNPGSVGYPRESGGKCLSSYVLYDSEEKTVVFRYLPFSVATVLQRGRPVKRRYRAAIWGAAALAAAATAVALSLALSRKPPEVRTVVVQSSDPVLLVGSATVDTAGFSAVAANLKLSRNSSPVQLDITFRTADGDVAGMERLTVRSSSKRRFKVPQGAKKALFELRKNAPGDRPEIESFKPCGL